MINVGDVYESTYDGVFKHSRKKYIQRFVKILSVTSTHVYVRNIRDGYQRNILIRDFENDYVLVPRNKNTGYNEEETLS